MVAGDLAPRIAGAGCKVLGDPWGIFLGKLSGESSYNHGLYFRLVFLIYRFTQIFGASSPILVKSLLCGGTPSPEANHFHTSVSVQCSCPPIYGLELHGGQWRPHFYLVNSLVAAIFSLLDPNSGVVQHIYFWWVQKTSPCLKTVKHYILDVSTVWSSLDPAIGPRFVSHKWGKTKGLAYLSAESLSLLDFPNIFFPTIFFKEMSIAQAPVIFFWTTGVDSRKLIHTLNIINVTSPT